MKLKHYDLSYQHTEETTQSLKVTQHIGITRTKVLKILASLSKSKHRKIRFLYINPAL